MADKISKEIRSKIMASIKSINTTPEVTLRSSLSKLGYKYRKNYGVYDIDIAFPGKKLGVFVDGCYWHCCPIHGHIPKSNSRYWLEKLRRNKTRDLKVNSTLKADGWTIIRLWEHDIKHNLNRSVSKITNRLANKSIAPNGI